MSDWHQDYNIVAIRKLLLAAFVPDGLRRLCLENPMLEPVVADFGPNYGLNLMIDGIVDYCRTRHLWDELLEAVQEANPRQYSMHGPYHRQHHGNKPDLENGSSGWKARVRNERQRRNRRQRFACHIELEIKRLDNLENWGSHRFTELEVEIEAEGRRRTLSPLPILRPRGRGLRRERSLSKAIEASEERWILLEGDPGSGKSVALRYVARKMANRAANSRSVRSPIPLYINLRRLRPSPGVAVDRNLIEAFVLKTLNRANDRDIEEFLEEEFERGLKEGTWLFLFDSFDELPDVLSAVEADKQVRLYADAIADFLGGMNQCRGIVASRHFRGPGQLGWPRFRILELSPERCQELIERVELDSEVEQELIGQLAIASEDMQNWAKKPMFLGLLCDYMKAGNPFPQHAHSVFEDYVRNRLERDEDRLWQKHQLAPSKLRRSAEAIAFCMAADPGLGLSPMRDKLRRALIGLGFSLPERFDVILNAMEYIKLAQADAEDAVNEQRPFAFEHRRFQEYFATCVVLREPERVSTNELLMNARWRETAVVMFQTQSLVDLSPLLEEARRLLSEMVKSTPGLIEDPIEYSGWLGRAARGETTDEDGDIEEPQPQSFTWPHGALHLLGLLQDGLGGRLEDFPEDLGLDGARLLMSAMRKGLWWDKKWSLEVAGTLPQPVLKWALQDAFASQSQWLREVAYRQVARLGEIPGEVADGIRQALLALFADGRLAQERHPTHAHLSRLAEKSRQFLDIARQLQWVAPIDAVLHVSLFAWLCVLFAGFDDSAFAWSLLVIVLLLLALNLFSLHAFSLFLILPRGVVSLRAFVALFVRVFVPLVVLLAGIQVQGGASLYAILLLWWAPCMLISARTGLFTRPVWWPIMPLLPLLVAVTRAKAVIKLIPKAVGWLLLFLVGATILLAPFGVLYMISESLMDAALFGVMLIYSLCLLGLGLQEALLRLGDWLRWQEWRTDQPKSLTVADLLESLDRYRKPDSVHRLIRAVRQQDLVPATPESEALLLDLALAIEQARFTQRRQRMEGAKKRSNPRWYWEAITVWLRARGKASKPARNPDMWPDTLAPWIAAYVEKDEDRLADLGPEFLDELYLLIGRLRSMRGGETM